MKNRSTNEFLDYYLEHIIRGNVSQSTYVAYRGYVQNHINRFIGEETLSTLKTEKIQYLISKLKQKKLANKTINSIMTMLKGALKCAVDYNFIDKNPCDKIRLPKLVEKEISILDKQSQSKLEQAIFDSSDARNYGILICLYSGIRIGELCALKWNSINLEKHILEIKSSLNRIATFEGREKKTVLLETFPKTKSSKRIIPISSFLIKILRMLKKKNKSEYVLSTKRGKPVEPRLMQNVLKKLLISVGIKHISFHALRHTFATRAIELGCDVKTVSVLLGHKNTMITVDRYTHSLFEQKLKMMEKLNNLHKQQYKLNVDKIIS